MAVDDLYERWAACYRERLAGSDVPELRIKEMARAAALRGDEPPPPRPVAAFPITAETLEKQAEEALQLTLLQKLRLWPGVGVVKGKVSTAMGNWRTTLLAAVAAALNYALVVVNNGTVKPQNAHDVLMLLLSASIVGLGAVMKDAATGSQPGDPPTKARIAGALAHGEKVPPEEIVESLQASQVVDAIAAKAPTRI